MRDLTRGGLSSAVNDIACARGVGIEIREADLQVSDPVEAACELLGLDVLQTANEGRFVAFVPMGQADQALAALHNVEVSTNASIIGRVTHKGTALATLRTISGAIRVLDQLSGEQLPRIC